MNITNLITILILLLPTIGFYILRIKNIRNDHKFQIDCLKKDFINDKHKIAKQQKEYNNLLIKHSQLQSAYEIAAKITEDLFIYNTTAEEKKVLEKLIKETPYCSYPIYNLIVLQEQLRYKNIFITINVNLKVKIEFIVNKSVAENVKFQNSIKNLRSIHKYKMISKNDTVNPDLINVILTKNNNVSYKEALYNAIIFVLKAKHDVINCKTNMERN